MKYGVTLPLSGIDGDVQRLVEFAHIAEEEGWEGVFLEDYIVTFLPRPIQTPRIPIWIGGFWPRKAPARRAARWDGFCPARLPDENGNSNTTPADIDAIKSFIAGYRSSETPFDLVVGGYLPADDPAKARAHVEPFVEAGATWWCEFVLPEPGKADMALTRIKQGPPRS